MSASIALEHEFIELSHHRGIGDRISLDRHRSYMFRRKCQVTRRTLTFELV